MLIWQASAELQAKIAFPHKFNSLTKDPELLLYEQRIG